MNNKRKEYFEGNRSLKATSIPVNFTGDQIGEYDKCLNDPVYFIENYCKIVSLDDGPVLFKMFPYQKRMIEAMHNNRKTVAKLFRQAGKSSIVAAYICWFVTFKGDQTVALLANKASTAREIFSRVQYMYQELPWWIQVGVQEWSKTKFKLGNNTVCFMAASSPDNIRGQSISMLFCDEFGILSPNLADEFIASVFPTISSSENSKIIIVSTPKGLNHFHKLWTDAEKGKNGFIPVSGHWSEHPKRNQRWADEQKAMIGELRYNQEILAEFLGSSSTLFDGRKLGTIVTNDPIFEKDSLKVYVEPKKDHTYVCVVDTSRGRHLDYSAFTIIDITEMPYQVVATFKDNTISTLEYPFLIMNTAKQYNEAYCLIEVNDAGGEIANTMWYEFEYENIYMTDKERLTEAAGYPGVRTTKTVKMVGCSVLKDMVEKDQLIINSHDILKEMGVFVQKKASYGADDTNINDDLMTTLWLFAWLTKQPLFADLTDTNIRSILAKKRELEISESMTPFGFIDSGDDEYDTRVNEPTAPNIRSIDDWLMN